MNKKTEGLRLCPFSWIEVSKPAGCFAIFGAKGSVVSEPQTCMSSKCQLWDDSANDCGLVSKQNS